MCRSHSPKFLTIDRHRNEFRQVAIDSNLDIRVVNGPPVPAAGPVMCGDVEVFVSFEARQHAIMGVAGIVRGGEHQHWDPLLLERGLQHAKVTRFKRQHEDDING